MQLSCRELKRKSGRAGTEFGKVADTPNKNSGTDAGPTAELPDFVEAVQADDGKRASVPDPQWIQTKGPGGISRPRTLSGIRPNALSHCRNRTLPTHKKSRRVDVCQFQRSESSSSIQIMAERGDALYVLTPNEVLVSTDRGKTWDSLGERPEGRAVALVITDAPQERNHTECRYDDVPRPQNRSISFRGCR